MRSASSSSRNGGTPLLHPGDPDVAAASSPSQGAAFTPQFYLDMRPRRRRRVARRSEATEPRSGRKRPRNQTLIKTSTGIWSVTYNGENRPVLWTCLQSNNQTITNQTIISMSFDRMGRRVTKNNQRFIYVSATLYFGKSCKEVEPMPRIRAQIEDGGYLHFYEDY